VKRARLVIAIALLAGACGSSTTTPTPPPPPVEDPPVITCPAPQTIQLTGTASTATTTYTPTFVKGKAPVVLSCTPPSGSAFGRGQSTVNCTATDALQRSSACSFTITVTDPPKLSLTRFVSFGDSITAGEDGIDGGPDTSGLCVPKVTTTGGVGQRVILPDAQTYPGQLQTKLAARYATQLPTVLKRGCPGEFAAPATLPSATRARFDALVSTGQYDIVLIMEGSNDLDAPVYSDPVGAAAAALRSFVTDAKSVGMKPLLATIPPMNPAGRRGSGAGKVTQLNDRIQQIAGIEAVPLVDVYAAFNGNLALLGDDGLHPNANGYAVIASAFFDVIKNTFEVKTAPVLSFRRR
jgi:lysophospholipase L1-like esterase